MQSTPRVLVRIQYSGISCANTVPDTPGNAQHTLAVMYERHGIIPSKTNPLRGRVKLTGSRVKASIIPLDD